MLSSAINPNYGNGVPFMPGDYEQWPREAARMRTIPPPQPLIRLRSQAVQRPPAIPTVYSERPHRSRRRSVTPDIVIDRRHHHHSSSGRHRVIRIPLDDHSTLGLRGSSKCVLEIERVPCRRRRKCRSLCHKHTHNIPPPPPYLQPHLNNVPVNPYVSPAQPSLMVSPNNSAGSLAFISNLTPEILENIPKEIIHLPPIFLPGCQADANTELHTVVFPAELINPMDGTLSIIQNDSARYDSDIAYAQPSVAVPTQSPSFDIPINPYSPLESLPMLSGPFMQHVQDIFERITLSATQSQLPSLSTVPQYNTVPHMPQYNAVPNLPYNPQSIPTINSTNVGFYPSANIRPTDTLNSNFYYPTTFTPSNPRNITPYRPPARTAATSGNFAPYGPANITPYQMANITPPNPRNITPYSQLNSTPSRSYGRTVAYPPPGRPNHASGPYAPANITPYSGATDRSPRSSTLQPYIPSTSLTSDSYNSYSAIMGNSPENIPNSSQLHSHTPYQPSTSMPRSILRNAPSNTTYGRFNLLNNSSSKDIVRKRGTYL